MIGKIGSVLGGPWGAIIGGAYIGMQTYESYLESQSPYPYLHNKYLYPCCSKKMEVYH